MSSNFAPAATSMGIPSVPARMATCEVGPPDASAMPPSFPRVDVDELRGREIAREQDAAGRDFETRRLRAAERGQHLAFEIEQIVDAFGEPRVAGGLQVLGARAQARAPCVTRALAGSHGAPRGVDDFRIVEQLEMRRHDLAHRGRRRRRQARQARTHAVARTIEGAMLRIDALPGFDHGHVGRL